MTVNRLIAKYNMLFSKFNMTFYVAVLIITSVGIFYFLLSVSSDYIFRYRLFYKQDDYDESLKKREEEWEISKQCLYYFFLTAELLWFTLVGLIFLPEIPMPYIVTKVISTGIHVPFIFLLCGRIIRKIRAFLTLENTISDMELKQSIWFIIVFLNVFVLIFNWEMSFSILAILAGKYIWLDTELSIQDMKDYCKKTWETFTFRELADGTKGYSVLFGHVILIAIALTVLGWGALFLLAVASIVII